MSIVHWRPPDALSDILATAWAPGVAPPREIRVRPEVHARLGLKPPDVHAAAGQLYDLPRSDMVPFIVDNRLPLYPGYEIHRRPPTERMINL